MWSRDSAAPPRSRSTGRWSTARERRRSAARSAAPPRLRAEAWPRRRHLTGWKVRYRRDTQSDGSNRLTILLLVILTLTCWTLKSSLRRRVKHCVGVCRAWTPEHSDAVSLLFYLHKPRSSPCHRHLCIYISFFVKKNCQMGNLPNRRSPRSKRRTFSGSPRQGKRRCGLPDGEVGSCTYRFPTLGGSAAHFLFSLSFIEWNSFCFNFNTTKKQQALKVNMETQLFIHLKYWYELTGQQYSPTLTF